MGIKSIIKNLSPVREYLIGKNLPNNHFYTKGKAFLEDECTKEAQEKGLLEGSKEPSRTTIINFLLEHLNRDCHYLEIGVRFPEDNYNLITAKNKYSVDPGLENESNPVDYQMTSDAFFYQLSNNEILSSEQRFDVVFIDGLHLAEQVDKDIQNSLKYLKEGGFIVLHDCNPPTEWHARERYYFHHSPAHVAWNGTSWKAFYKWRCNPAVSSCCIDTDWGVGIISKSNVLGDSIDLDNSFYEFHVFEKQRKKALNLISVEGKVKNRLNGFDHKL